MTANDPSFFRKPFKAMGSPCELQLFAESDAAASYIARLVIGEVERLEALYSRYRPESFLSAINNTASEGGTIAVDPETASLLDYAAACYAQSDRMFDITSGILRRAWRFNQNEPPNAEQIRALLDRVGWEKVVWQPPLLTFGRPGMEIDFGGVVKEYAVDCAAAICRNAGAVHAVINLGGDLRVVGPRADGSAWNIGIRHPRNMNVVLRTISMRGGALASSGDYERCILFDGVRYGHVLNPKTGWPVRHMASVSVVGELCVVAGSASTIGMLKEQEGPDWLAELGLPHLWANTHGDVGGSLC